MSVGQYHDEERLRQRIEDLERENERLRLELQDTRNAVRLAAVRDSGIPWPDVDDSGVESFVDFIRRQREAAEAAKEKTV